ncbi:MAG TPA: FtsX-like permease family protein [Burkholderiaceae bacterium]|nr:FtsX-like permease family protein [Burkholderiaceae bacterium]
MNTLSLAWRNLLRNRRRSLMTLIAMILGLTAVLLFGGYIRDINYSLQTNFVTSTGHLQIQHKDYFRFGSGNPSAYGIQNYERVIAAVRKDPVIAPMLAVITPTLQFGAIAGNFAASVSRTVFINGTVVEDQNQMREWNDYGQRDLSSRHLSLSGTPPDTAVIGTGVARVLHLCAPLKVEDCAPEDSKKAVDGAALPDDISDLAMLGTTKNAVTKPDAGPRIEILAANARGAPNVAGVNVLAAEFQGVKEVDDIYIALHLSQAQKLVFGAAPPQATAIAIQLKHTAQIPEVRARLETLLTTELRGEPLAVLDYETLNPFYGQTLAMFAAIFGFISMLMGSIVLFTVSNTMSMAVVERTSEIGTLRAMGLRQSGIRAMFVSEGIVLGCFGAVLGIGIAAALAWVINSLGLTWVPPGRNEPVPLAVNLAGAHWMIIASAVGLVVVAALSAILPAARAARMTIVDALRHV